MMTAFGWLRTGAALVPNRCKGTGCALAPPAPLLQQHLKCNAAHSQTRKPEFPRSLRWDGWKSPAGLAADGAADIADLPHEVCGIRHGTSRWEILSLEIPFSMSPIPCT